MTTRDSKIECPHRELAAYIDGELTPRETIELELHLSACRSCAAELNEQKRLLCALDFALEGEREFKLPENFARVVAANAESRVSGLRSPKERLNAGFVMAALFLTFLLGFGSQVKTVAETFVRFGEQILTVGNFTAHLIYNVGAGASLLLRSVGSQLIYNRSAPLLFIAAFFVAVLFALSRYVVRRQSI